MVRNASYPAASDSDSSSLGKYSYKKYSNYGHYKRDEDVEKREAAPEPEPEPAGKYTSYGWSH
jgi:hypothetical protein